MDKKLLDLAKRTERFHYTHGTGLYDPYENGGYEPTRKDVLVSIYTQLTKGNIVDVYKDLYRAVCTNWHTVDSQTYPLLTDLAKEISYIKPERYAFREGHCSLEVREDTDGFAVMAYRNASPVGSRYFEKPSWDVNASVISASKDLFGRVFPLTKQAPDPGKAIDHETIRKKYRENLGFTLINPMYEIMRERERYMMRDKEEIKEALIESADARGWTMEINDNSFSIQKFSDAGEDFSAEFPYDHLYDIPEIIKDYARDFDENEHVEVLMGIYRNDTGRTIEGLTDDADAYFTDLENIMDAVNEADQLYTDLTIGQMAEMEDYEEILGASVIPWYIVTLSPISVVSPITTPIPWSINNPLPIVAPG